MITTTPVQVLPQDWVTSVSFGWAFFLVRGDPGPVPHCGMDWVGLQHSYSSDWGRRGGGDRNTAVLRADCSLSCFWGYLVCAFLMSCIQAPLPSPSICPRGPPTSQGACVLHIGARTRKPNLWLRSCSLPRESVYFLPSSESTPKDTGLNLITILPFLLH